MVPYMVICQFFFSTLKELHEVDFICDKSTVTKQSFIKLAAFFQSNDTKTQHDQLGNSTLFFCKLYNHVPRLTQETTWESDNNAIKHHKREPRGQLFPSR